MDEFAPFWDVVDELFDKYKNEPEPAPTKAKKEDHWVAPIGGSFNFGNFTLTNTANYSYLINYPVSQNPISYTLSVA